MRHTVVIKRRAEPDLDRLPDTTRTRIVARLFDLEDEPRPRGSRQLQGLAGRRLRIGDFRVLYEVDDAEHKVVVFAVGHRREVYR